MKSVSLASATSIALLLSSVLLVGCATTPAPALCDTTQSVGSCAVTVQTQGSRLVVCPVKESTASPACMNASLDVKRLGQAPRKSELMLEPGRCVPLSTEVKSATFKSCEAFALTKSAAP